MNKNSLIKILNEQFNINDVEKTDILYKLLDNQEKIDKENNNEKGFLLEVINTFINNKVFDLINVDVLGKKEEDTPEYHIAASITQNQLKSLENYNIDGIAQVMSVVTHETTHTITTVVLKKLMDLGNKNKTKIDLTKKIVGAESLHEVHKSLIKDVGNVVKTFSNEDLFFVTNVQMAVMFQNISGFRETKLDNKISEFAGNLYQLGEIKIDDKNVKVYVDPNMTWGSTKILIGEKTEDFVLKLYTIFNPSLEVEGTRAPQYANRIHMIIDEKETKSFKVINIDLGENILI